MGWSFTSLRLCNGWSFTSLHLCNGFDVTQLLTPAAAVAVAAAVGLRFCRHRARAIAAAAHTSASAGLPYAAKTVVCGQRELVIVATLHISPKSPRDVTTTIEAVQPSCVLIELDEQRLAQAHAREQRADPDRKSMRIKQSDVRDDMQALTITSGIGSVDLHAVRASWNGELAGASVDGHIAVNSEDGSARSSVLLLDFNPRRVCRDVLAAQRAGASAIFFLQGPNAPGFPSPRIDVQWNLHEIGAAIRAREWGLFRLPCFLLSPLESTIVLNMLGSGTPSARASFTVRGDEFPRSSLKSILLQRAVMFTSGVWILYGGMQLAKVKVGEEFHAAERSAKKSNIPCLCCDLTLGSLGARIKECIRPSVHNLILAAKQWIEFPGALLNIAFPADGDVDVLGCFFLWLAALSARTWLAFAGSVTAATAVLYFAMMLPGTLLGQAVSADAESAAKLSERITFALMLYLLPRVKAAMLDSRDDAMYRSAAAVLTHLASDRHGSGGARGSAGAEVTGTQRVVLVCGGAHANGILRRAREQRLGLCESEMI